MIKKILPKLIFPLLLLALVGVLSYSNYAPGTFLSGWDNLHPEFNFSLYLKRSIFGAWQQHQGIGAPAAQAFAAELTRLPVVYLLSLILPMNLVRYSFFFLTLAIGTFGMYFLSRYFLSEGLKKYINASSFLAAVFYLLNLATLQQYFDPLEMFAVHFATLPWLILFAAKYLKESGKKNLIWFCLVTLFSSSMAHTATLFYAYFAALAIFIETSFLLNLKKGFFKRGVILILLTITLNSFWLAPNIYYVLRESGTVANSRINRTFSDEAYLQSRAFGDIKNLGILKNFPFNWREYDYSTDSFEDLMRVWDTHLSQPGVSAIGYGAVIFAVLGILSALFRKSKFALSLLPVLGLGVFFWLWGIPKELPLLREALRFPFTKFSILIICSLSVFFAFSSQSVLNLLAKIKLGFIFVILSVGALIYFMLPAFQGNFIDPSMKVKIPDEYFQMFKWFNGQDPAGRVAKLPMHTFWDWNYYSWGYQGGGFTWFGIRQPTLDREFDRWGLYNEDFYSEASSTLYGNDPAGFILALKKYQVKYLLLDESVINPGGSPDILYISQIKDLLSKSPDIREAAKFNFLTIYETDFDTGKDFIPLREIPGALAHESEQRSFRFGGIPLPTKLWEKIPWPLGRGSFISAPQTQTEDIKPHLLEGDLLLSEDLSVNKGFPQAYNCDIKKEGNVYKQNLPGKIVYAAGGGGVSCDFLNFPGLKYDQAYILHIAGENRQGRSLKIYFTNYKTGRAELEELLPNGEFDKEFYIYPTKLTGKGYSLNFETRSYGPINSENIITKVEIYNAGLEGQSSDAEHSIENNLKVAEVKKYGPWAYVVEVGGGGIIELGQGYEEGWKAIPFKNLQFTIYNFQSSINVPIFKQEFKHIKFNGWANGWIVPNCQNENSLKIDNCKLVIVYWPQLLEFGGIIVALVSILICFVSRRG